VTLEAATLVGGEKILSHSPELCAGRHCCVHNHSRHHMVEWKQFWRGDRQILERICPTHGVGHPDPDHLSYIKETFGVRQANVASIHGCCGCCSSKHRDNPNLRNPLGNTVCSSL
jgi:hypothetical protein